MSLQLVKVIKCANAKKDNKEQQLQMNFVRECDKSCHCEVSGTVVHRLEHGAVSPLWLSDCAEERALTEDHNRVKRFKL